MTRLHFIHIPFVAIVVALAYASTFVTSVGTMADDPGLGWHLATGRYIVQRGEIPHTDPFLALPKVENVFASSTRPRAWICDQWLSDVILFGTFALGGWPLLYGLALGLYTIAFFGVAGDGVRRHSSTFLLGITATVLAFKAGQVHLIIRPVLFSILFFAVVIKRAHQLSRTQLVSGNDLKREAMYLAPLFALWANLHPAFVYGLILIAILTLARIIEDPKGPEWTRLAGLFLICIGSTMLNPCGFALYSTIGQLANSSFLRSVTTEWAPLDMASLEAAFILILVLVPVLIAALLSSVRRSFSVFDLLVPLFFVSQALLAVRVLPFAALACIPLWGRMSEVRLSWPVPSFGRLTINVWRSLAVREATFRNPGLVSAALVSILGAALITYFPNAMLPAPRASKSVILVERLLSQLTVQGDSHGTILASPDLGGALAYAGDFSFKAVVDDRASVVGEKLYRSYYACLKSPEQCKDMINVFGVTHLFLPPNSSQAAFFSSQAEWSVAITEQEIMVLRRASRSADSQLFRGPK